MLVFILQFFFMFSHIQGGYEQEFPPPLSAKEENELISKMQKGDAEARNLLIEHNLRLVAHIVKKYPNHAKDNEDLLSIGTIGLIKAVSSFDADKGVKLVTYAARCIENEILMSIRSGKKFSLDVSLQNVVGVDKDGNEITLLDKVADDGDSVEDAVNLKMQIARMLKKVKSVLTNQEQRIIELRYGLTGDKEITQREIAKMMGISRSYVSRIEKKALEKIRKEM